MSDFCAAQVRRIWRRNCKAIPRSAVSRFMKRLFICCRDGIDWSAARRSTRSTLPIRPQAATSRPRRGRQRRLSTASSRDGSRHRTYGWAFRNATVAAPFIRRTTSALPRKTARQGPVPKGAKGALSPYSNAPPRLKSQSFLRKEVAPRDPYRQFESLPLSR